MVKVMCLLIVAESDPIDTAVNMALMIVTTPWTVFAFLTE